MIKTEQSSTHNTPAGGDRSTIYYQDIDGHPVDRSRAVQAEIVEFLNDKPIARTYGTLSPPNDLWSSPIMAEILW